MKKIIAAIGLLLAFATPTHAQQAVKQSGTITPNHIVNWVTNGVIGDGGTANDSPISSLGVTNNTTAGFCVSSGRQTAAGRQQLCLGAPLNAPAQLTVQNYGTATAQGFQIVVDGTTTVIPGGSTYVAPAIKLPVDAASTGANVNIASAPTSLDGVTGTVATPRMRWLLKDQTTVSQNGIYDFNGAGVALTRSLDFNTSGQVVQGTQIYVTQGSTNKDKLFSITTANPITIGSSTVVFAPSIGSANVISAADYGAIGDNTTLNDTAFANAVTAAVALGGATIVLPAGKFAVSTDTTMNNCAVGVYWRGAGRNATIIRQTGATANGFVWDCGFSFANGGGLAGITIEAGTGYSSSGNVYEGTGSTGTGLLIKRMVGNGSFFDFSINNFYKGLDSEASWNNDIHFFQILYSKNTGLAVNVDNTLPVSGGARISDGIVTFNMAYPTNGATAAGNDTLHFASVPAWFEVGMAVIADTNGITPGTTILSTTATTVVMSANAIGSGVGNGDTIRFYHPTSVGFTTGQTGGNYYDRIEFGGFGTNCQLKPNVGAQIAYDWFNTVVCDGGYSAGWDLDSTNGAIQSVAFTNIWGAYTQNGPGFKTSGANKIGDITVTAGRFRENVQQGVNLQTASGIAFIGGEINANGRLSANSYPGVTLADGLGSFGGPVAFTNVQCGNNASAFSGQSDCIQDGGNNTIKLIANDFSNPGAGKTGFVPGAGSTYTYLGNSPFSTGDYFGTSGGIAVSSLLFPKTNDSIAFGSLTNAWSNEFSYIYTLMGATSGTLTQTPPAIAGSVAITWGTGSGTPAVTASSPLAISSATGDITCSTCVTGTSGAITAGTTSTSGFSANQIAYSDGTHIQNLATANSSVLITSGAGAPSLSTTLPSGIAATNMNLTTPTLGVASATTVNKVTITTPATGSTLTVADGKIAKFDNTIEFSGPDGTVFPVSGVSTWTPTDASGAGLSLTVTDAVYTRIGSTCVVSFSLQWPVTADGSNASVGGLPCTSRNGTNNYVGGGGLALSSTTNGPLTIGVANNGTNFLIFNASATPITNAQMSTFIIRGTITYITN